jgi:hypothetical protein
VDKEKGASTRNPVSDIYSLRFPLCNPESYQRLNYSGFFNLSADIFSA